MSVHCFRASCCGQETQIQLDHLLILDLRVYLSEHKQVTVRVMGRSTKPHKSGLYYSLEWNAAAKNQATTFSRSSHLSFFSTPLRCAQSRVARDLCTELRDLGLFACMSNSYARDTSKCIRSCRALWNVLLDTNHEDGFVFVAQLLKIFDFKAAASKTKLPKKI